MYIAACVQRFVTTRNGTGPGKYTILVLRSRRGGRVAEGARLESVCTRKGTEGSNPSPSARHRKMPGLYY